MKFSESWLREWVNPQVAINELCEQLTMAGLEVDGVELAAAEFSGVIVGEIVGCEQHPDADKLRVCQVKGHPEGDMQVVCGAPNARIGIKIPFATVGAKLPGDFKIKKAKLRGVESFGMLCAEEELGFAEKSDGLWELAVDAPVGTDIRDYLMLNDTIVEVDLTPNRSDCLGIRGIARETGVLNRIDVTEPVIDSVQASIDDSFPVTLEAVEHCPRYVGRVIRNVSVNAQTPLWMVERLRRSGVRSIDPVVDVTNYVLLELGQPMHAFDLNKLEGGITVRMAEEGEKLQLLDGQEVELNSKTLVIADGTQAVAMAGIMGGEATAVSGETKDIFLESAFFQPVSIAGRARDYGLHTDSSHRFERGVDHQLQELAIERATALLLGIVGGEPGPVVLTEDIDNKPAGRKVELRKARIESYLGMRFTDEEATDILTRIGLNVIDSSDSSWTFAVPSYRFDISIEEDLLEELARVYGYNRLTTRTPKVAINLPETPETKIGLPAARSQLIALGYQEAIAYSFIEPQLNKLFDPDVEPVALRNPISADMAVMRTSLWPGLISLLKHNINRQQPRVRLFETGQRFVPVEGGLNQEPVIAGLIYGSKMPEGWAGDAEGVDFYDLKGDVEALLSIAGNDFTFTADKHNALHPGQTASVSRNGEVIGYLGALHPQLQQELGLNQPVYLFELVQNGLLESRLPSFTELSKFPEVRRDIAVVLDKEVLVGQLLDSVSDAAGEYLIDLKVFDVYAGKGIDPQRKSVALGLTFQHPSRTLNEGEVNEAVDAVVSKLGEQFQASLR
ncbi:MAG: phenylalanine--tRNA ligase subunit beta [Cellvibrionaceae bacterium]